MLFGFFGGPFGLIFFLVGRQILKFINTITGKFVLKVIFIYVWIVESVTAYLEVIVESLAAILAVLEHVLDLPGVVLLHRLVHRPPGQGGGLDGGKQDKNDPYDSAPFC